MVIFRRLILIFFIFGLVFAGFAVYWFKQKIAEPLMVPDGGLVYEVQSGASLHSVAKDLENKGIIKHAIVLKALGKLEKRQYSIKSGEYRLTPDLNLTALLALLSSSRQVQYEVTLIEGWQLSEALMALQQHPKIRGILNGIEDKRLFELASNMGARNTLEGMFFPDTYHFVKGDTDFDILKRAYQRMQDKLEFAWQMRDAHTPVKTPYEALILASIIEKETSVPNERGLIAGVFADRLQKRMRLQTDPTVIYGLGDAYQGNLTRKHLLSDNPYNTYRHFGLPPSPIALPGFDSIKAAINPVRKGYLYFVAKGDGSHYFSKTLAEHNKAVREFQVINRKKNYRSVQ